MAATTRTRSRRPKTQAPASPVAIAYLRVSTDEQGASGLGLEAQETAIRQGAERQGLQVGAVFTDAGVSGAAPLDKRPALAEALARLRKGDTLMVAKRDRLARLRRLGDLLGEQCLRGWSCRGQGTLGNG